MTEEEKKQRSERMKEIWAKKKQEAIAIPPVEEKNNLGKLLAVVEGVMDSIKGIDSRLKKIEEMETGVNQIEIKPQEISLKMKKGKKVEAKNIYEVPSDWQKVVEEVLGSDFECDAEANSSGDFILKVYVPRKWDRRIGDEKSIDIPDCSTGLIRRVSPLNDVRYWCEKIKNTIKKQFSNFNK